MKEKFQIFRSAIFAGVCIGIAGFGFLADKTLGMFLFIFGLATVVSYKLKLYTGTAGFVKNGSDMLDLLLVLVGNWVGCYMVALLARCSAMPICETAQTLLEGRLAVGPWRGGLLAIGCGVLMTTSVTFARKSRDFGHWVPLLFAVPLFILCGFPHCVADAFYYLCCPLSFWMENMGAILLFYLCIVVGNFIGCNLYRLFVKEE